MPFTAQCTFFGSLGMRSATTAFGSFAGDSASMSLTKSVLRFGLLCSIRFVLDGAKVNHIFYSPKVIGINENKFRRVYFDNFNNQCLREILLGV